MGAFPISTAKFYEILKAFIQFCACKYNVEQLWISASLTRMLLVKLCLLNILVFKNMCKERQKLVSAENCYFGNICLTWYISKA